MAKDLFFAVHFDFSSLLLISVISRERRKSIKGSKDPIEEEEKSSYSIPLFACKFPGRRIGDFFFLLLLFL